MSSNLQRLYLPRWILTGWATLMLPLAVCSQEGVDSVEHLPDVMVTEERVRELPLATVRHHWTADRVEGLPIRHAADLFSTSASVYIKGYGLGSLSTSSVRGGSAAQLLVMWNDIPIHSPMLGQLDLSLLPVQLFDDVSLTEGGQSAAHGSGAVAGVLAMTDHRPDATGVQVSGQTEGGAFGYFGQQLSATIASPRWHSRTKLSYQELDNDFTYRPAPQLAERRQEHSAFIGRNIMQELGYQLGKRHSLTWSAWYQSADRQIPPTLVQRQSQAYQDDRSLRTQLHYHHQLRRGGLDVRAAYVQEDIDFYDPQIRLASPTSFSSYWGRGRVEQRYGRHRLTWGIDYVHTTASANGYADTQPNEYRIATYLSWVLHHHRWSAEVQARQAVIDDERIDPSVMAGLVYRFIDGLTWSAKASYDYRAPTLNDRYWRPGGRPDLRPETGWSIESSIRASREAGHARWVFEATAFHRRIRDWILWYPDPEATYWSPNNIAVVWSRGVSTGLSYEWAGPHLTWRARADYSYIRSTNEDALPSLSIAAGDQLIYTPEHNATLQLSLKARGVEATYLHRYTDDVNAINERLDAFHTGDLQLSYQLPISGAKVVCFGSLHNVWDEDYIVVERRPMAGRHARFGIRYGWQQHHK